MPIIPAGEFRRSRKLYAVKPDTFQVQSVHEDFSIHQNKLIGDEVFHRHMYDVLAVWFRKRSTGVMAAYIGILADTREGVGQEYAAPQIPDFQSYLKEYDGRYGAYALGCIDENGARWWAKFYADDYSKQEAATPILQNMIANFGKIPEGFEGWYSVKE